MMDQSGLTRILVWNYAEASYRRGGKIWRVDPKGTLELAYEPIGIPNTFTWSWMVALVL